MLLKSVSIISLLVGSILAQTLGVPKEGYLEVFDTPLKWRKELTQATAELGEVVYLLEKTDTFQVLEREKGLVGDVWLFIAFGVDTIFVPRIEGFDVVYDTLIFQYRGWVLESIKKGTQIRYYVEYLDGHSCSGWHIDILGLIGLKLLWGDTLRKDLEELEGTVYTYPYWRGIVAFVMAMIISFILFSKWTCEWFPVYKKLDTKYKFLVWVVFMLGCAIYLYGTTISEIAILFRR